VLEELEQYHADSYGWALACCGWRRDQAEDVLQEAYLRVLDGRARFAGKSSRRTWFFGVIRRVAGEARRRRQRSALLNLRLVGVGSDEPDAESAAPAEYIYREQSSRQLQAALMQLAARQREVLHLVFYAGMSLEETALTLRISLGSSRTHYHRGKARLAELLESGEGYEPDL
jgi:RNA polymerase sigma-70 factor (ECF subfamily)